jgi:Zn-dependent protease
MSWTFNLLTVRGIAIKIHLTFAVILILGGLNWGQAHGVGGFVFGVALMAALFACVTLHELGHSVAAQFYRIPVREIVLLPIGGVALLGRMPKKPVQELVIAAAGPLVNVVIAGVLLLIGGMGSMFSAFDREALAQGVVPGPSLATFLGWLLVANISLVLFNLLPAFPLDGGRILRATLALATNYRNATAIAASVGQTAAVLLGVFGVLSGQIILALIAVFVFFGARAEQIMVERGDAPGQDTPDEDAEPSQPPVLIPAERLSSIAPLALSGGHRAFAVMIGDRLLGVLTREAVLHAARIRSDDPYVAELMDRDVLQVDVSANVADVQRQMGSKKAPVAAVFEGEHFLGLVSRDNLRQSWQMLMTGGRTTAVDER